MAVMFVSISRRNKQFW